MVLLKKSVIHLLIFLNILKFSENIWNDLQRINFLICMFRKLSDQHLHFEEKE